MNFARGIIAGLMGAVIGFVGPILVVATYTILSWSVGNASGFDRQYDVAWWQIHAIPPLVGVSIYVGLTAWATYTPTQNHGYAKTLAILFFSAIPFTFFLATLELTPQRSKSLEHPSLYLSEFLLLFVPPFLIACLLVTMRQPRAVKIEAAAAPDTAPT